MDNQEKMLNELAYQAGERLYDLAAAMESFRRAETSPAAVHRWNWQALSEAEQEPYIHDALMVARDHPAVKVEG